MDAVSQHSLIARIKACVQLMRPANVLTAVADILAGVAVSGLTVELADRGNGWFFIPELGKISFLVLSSASLYAGGVVLNDFFDAELDKKERPERPIPSGLVPRTVAFFLGVVLLSIGIQVAAFVSLISVGVAVGVALLIAAYNGLSKHHSVFGPLNMGLCRGGNLLLGISAVPYAMQRFWFIAFIPVIYIAAITMISRGEVKGSTSGSLRIAGWLYALTIMFILSLSAIPFFHLRLSLPYLVLFAGVIFSRLKRAQSSRQPADIRSAVKAGVLALILMDAAIAAGFSGWDYGLLIVLLLPLSVLIAKNFAVT
ncbi:MAG: transferase [Chitinophagales bacterium]|nr:MAG: transferase [Chitinophagales bacterium]